MFRYLLLAAVAALAACSAGDDRPADREVVVVAEPVRFLPDENILEAVGTARAARSAEIYAEVSGRVTAVRFEPGGFVRAGQVLIELDARRERLALKLAEVRVEEARQLLGRYRRIEDTGALSDSQIEAGETALAAAQIERDQAAVALAERTIRSPFAGHVSFSEIDPGDRVTPETLIAQIDQRSRLFVDFNAPEAVFNRLSKGESVDLVPFSEPDSAITSTIEAVDSTIEQEQRSYVARVAIDNRGDRFRPGMSFSVRFTDTGPMRPAVPEAAVMWTGEGSSVFAVREGKAVRVPVSITSRREGTVLLDGKIGPDTRIIIEGVQKVREGQAVRLIEQARPAPAKVEVAG
ncbi:efflux RND transporter periplasmic adaptor subunit [Porphyrobacter sp. YT40]|uniref:efflux RND transporter periplasmic adaptor subunit n=1 Tax=Porphyrobacter sp. YT40 TaxID=2547601 RepID=UPI0011421DCA|nr:efflux RND transporter periplasmic adaptor subunit [Porphyrobacter sp. YT40]QDH34275.1 efflux RND transporter periplasmic adaptor subunit [Porphyrobacter sp. YT40]